MNRYPTKAAWAEAKAEALRKQAKAMLEPGQDWRADRRRADAAARLFAEASRFDSIAARMKRAA